MEDDLFDDRELEEVPAEGKKPNGSVCQHLSVEAGSDTLRMPGQAYFEVPAHCPGRMMGQPGTGTASHVDPVLTERRTVQQGLWRGCL